MGPFDRFNDRAKRVLALAQDEAIRLNHNYIGPEHLLLGLIREGEGVAARVLTSLGADLGRVRQNIDWIIGRGKSDTTPSEIVLTPRTKRVIDFAIDEAKKLGHSHVGTEHLLLGIVRDGEQESAASQLVNALGITLEAIRERTIAMLGQQHPATPARPAETWRLLVDAQGRKRDWYCEDVLSGKLTVKVLYEDERVLGIEHPYPQYQIHGVVIPKTHVASLMATEALDGELLASMLKGVQAVATALGLTDKGFRLEANAAAPGVTPHMHWHVAGPGLPPRARGQWRGAAFPSATPRQPGTGPSIGPFDRFDDTGKRVLALAQEEAIRLNHNYIGTEHLLAGLVRGADDVGARALQELGVEITKVRTALEFIIGRGERPTTPSEITLSPRSKKVIELAFDEARKLGHAHVGSGHLLLGLVREGEGIASGILESLGIALGQARRKVLEIMGRREPPAPPAGG